MGRRQEFNIEDKSLWYLVGLIASDGCLSKDGRHIDITSSDYSFLSQLRDNLKLTNKVGTKYNSEKKQSFHIQISNRNFYDFLLTTGLTTNKSLVLGALKVPDQFFGDFLRGLIDGDGCLRRWRHASNKGEQWSLRIYSGSKEFIEWVRDKIESLFKAKGRIHQEAENCYSLKYGKMAARVIAKRCYYPGCLGLERKIQLANRCLNSFKGWRKSKTICCLENDCKRRDVGMADNTDLKSVGA